MSKQHSITVNAHASPGSADPIAWLQRLPSALSEIEMPRDVSDLVTPLSSALDRVLAEHEGMADELLSVYEQLGIVFDVTKRLPTVRRESEVLDMFVDSLQRSFAQRSVSVLRPGRDGSWLPDGNTPSPADWIVSVVTFACDTRSVIVERPPQDASGDAIVEALVGPVFAGEEIACAIILQRTHETPAFSAGEMLIIESLSTFCGDLIRNHRLMRELREMSISMVRSLVSAVDQKDEYTSGHSLRVGYYATALGRELGLDDVDLQMLQWSALLHDVGKIGIRDDVLNKNGRLTDEEFSHIKEHPVRSHRVVRTIPQLADALDGVLYHHERYDGTGYPAGLKGENIPLQARIIQIADVFDALTSSRSYRGAYDWTTALAILQEESGKTVDPRLQGIFSRLIRAELEHDPSAWTALVERASRFAQTTDDTSDRGNREDV